MINKSSNACAGPPENTPGAQNKEVERTGTYVQLSGRLWRSDFVNTSKISSRRLFRALGV
jgi:hypothetical protein